MSLAVSVLDLASVKEGGSIREAFENSVKLARAAERLGYSRFWMAEHHNITGIASAATAVSAIPSSSATHVRPISHQPTRSHRRRRALRRSGTPSPKAGPALAYGSPMSFRQFAVAVERVGEAVRSRRSRSQVPAHFRIEPYLGHGSPSGAVVRGRVLDNPPETEAEEGEGMVAAVLRTVRDFLTHELPGVPLEVTVAGASVDTVTDAEGYFLVEVPVEPGTLMSPWTRGSVALAGEYRGITGSRSTPRSAPVSTSP